MYIEHKPTRDPWDTPSSHTGCAHRSDSSLPQGEGEGGPLGPQPSPERVNSCRGGMGETKKNRQAVEFGGRGHLSASVLFRGVTGYGLPFHSRERVCESLTVVCDSAICGVDD